MKTYSNLSCTGFILIFVGCFGLLVMDIVCLVYFAIDVSKFSQGYWIQCVDTPNLFIITTVGLVTTVLPFFVLIIIFLFFKNEKFHCIFPFVVLIGVCIVGSTICCGVEYHYSKDQKMFDDTTTEMLSKYQTCEECSNAVSNEFNCSNDECIASLLSRVGNLYNSTKNHSIPLMITFVIVDVITIIGIIALFGHFPCDMQSKVRRMD